MLGRLAWLVALVVAAGSLTVGLLRARGTMRGRSPRAARIRLNHVRRPVQDEFIQSVLFDGEGPECAVSGVELILSHRRERPWAPRSAAARHRSAR